MVAEVMERRASASDSGYKKLEVCQTEKKGKVIPIQKTHLFVPIFDCP